MQSKKGERCFIAIDLPQELITELSKIQTTLKKQKLFTGKMIEPENIHLTLKFLGEINEEKREAVKACLKKVRFNKFTMSLKQVSVFSEKFIRIIWVKVSGKKVYDLQTKIDDAFKNLFPKEQRFMGHITIARVKKVVNKKALLEYLKKIKIKEQTCIMKKFILKSSELTPEKAVYKNLAAYPCKSS